MAIRGRFLPWPKTLPGSGPTGWVVAVRAAGGVATDLTGDDWTVTSPSVLVGLPRVHAQLLDLVQSVGELGDY